VQERGASQRKCISPARWPGATTVCRLHKENRGMRKVLFILSTALALVGFLGVQKYLGAKEDKKKKPQYSIKQVMKLAHKQKLMQRVAKGDGSKEDKEKLLGLYIALRDGKPPRGDAKDWKERCKAI